MRTGVTTGTLALLGALALGCGGAQTDASPQEITIPRGATLAAVAETLQTRGLIRSATLFAFYARMSGRRRAIQAGTYDVPPNATNRELLDLLSTGRPALRRLVVPEGLFLAEVAAAVEQQLGIPAERLLAAARDSALRARLALTTPTLEGYLYPSTYLVRTDAGAAAVVRQMVAEFETVWLEQWNARLDTLGLTRHEIVTLASIIEGEVRFAPDRPYVSSVYHNRLRQGMRLQADPTVIYALGRRRRLFTAAPVRARLPGALTVQHVPHRRFAARSDRRTLPGESRSSPLPRPHRLSLLRGPRRRPTRLLAHLRRAPARHSGSAPRQRHLIRKARRPRRLASGALLPARLPHRRPRCSPPRPRHPRG